MGNIEATRTFGETARDVCVPINPKPVRSRHRRSAQRHTIKLRQSHRFGRWVGVVGCAASEKSKRPIVAPVFYHVDASRLVPNPRKARPPNVRFALELLLGQIY